MAKYSASGIILVREKILLNLNTFPSSAIAGLTIAGLMIAGLTIACWKIFTYRPSLVSPGTKEQTDIGESKANEPWHSH